VFASSLPYAYRNYDLNRGYKVVVNEPRPYLRGNVYRTKYSNYYNNYQRQNIVQWYNRRFETTATTTAATTASITKKTTTVTTAGTIETIKNDHGNGTVATAVAGDNSLVF
jgi:hypothetical protein